MGLANIVPGYVGLGYSKDTPPLFDQSGDGENLTTTNASSTASNVTAPSGRGGRDPVFRVMLSEEGYVRINGTAAVGTGQRCVADVEYYFPAGPGVTLSVIDTA